MKILKYFKCFGYLILALLLLFGLYLGVTWLVTPRVKSMELKPFSGNYWHNPYQGVNLNNVYHADFHSHSDVWGIFVEGRNNRPQDLYTTYKRVGFDIMPITDYQSINRFRSTEPDYIPTYEHGYNFKKTHLLVLGAKRVFWYDVMLPQTTGMKQYFINKLKSNCELLCLAHPKSFKVGYSDQDLLTLTGYDLFEVLGRDDSRQEVAWDLVLSHGNLVYLLANDDMHDMIDWTRISRRFTRVFSDNTSARNVLNALKNGCHYGVVMPISDEETLDQKAKRIKELPTVTRFEIVNDTLFVQLDEPMQAVTITGDLGIELSRYSDSNEVVFRLDGLPDNITYVRVKTFLPNHVIYYFNPITRTSTSPLMSPQVQL